MRIDKLKPSRVKPSESEREKFVALIQQHAGGSPARRYSFARQLMVYGAAFRRAQENFYKEKDGMQKVKKLFTATYELCMAFDCQPVVTADTTRNTMVIEVSSGYSNSFGGGICVPTS
jgi:hypothetical protein